MPGRELLFAALFLYFVSPAACLSTDHANNNKGDMRAASRSTAHLLVQINYDWYGMICTGFHLKHTIVVTGADCVYGRETAKLSVKIKGAQKWDQATTARVTTYMVNPLYRNGIDGNNLALMVVKHKKNVMLFHIPVFDYLTHQLQRRKVKIYVNEWHVQDYQTLVSHSMQFNVTNQLEMCEVFEPIKDWYCLVRGNYAPIYTQRDVGSPMYYEDGARRVVLGVYTGFKKGLNPMGHLFEKIYPMREWIRKFFRAHHY